MNISPLFKDKRSVGFLLLGALLGLWLLLRGGEEVASPPTPRVTVVKVTRTPWTEELEALGTARANESLDITANVTETISEIHFGDGQQVKAGDPIVSLAVGEEAAELAAANAQLEEERRELRRLEPLLKTRAIAQRTYDERRTAVEVAARAVQQVKARVGDRVITAPFAGVLGLRNVSVGTLVEPGDLITTLDDIDTIKLDFTMPATYLSSIQAGGKVTARTPAYPDRQFEGKVVSLDSRIDPDTRSIAVRALLDNPKHLLRPGMLMYVALQNNARESLTLPEEALQLKGDKALAYVIGENGRVKEAEVRIGARRRGEVEILDGLQEAERVVRRGHARVRPGQAVDATETDGLDNVPSEKKNAASRG